MVTIMVQKYFKLQFTLVVLKSKYQQIKLRYQKKLNIFYQVNHVEKHCQRRKMHFKLF